MLEASLPDVGSAEDLAFESVTSIAARIRRREISPVELVELMLTRIARIDPELNAFTVVMHEAARAAARRAERALGRRGGETLGPLHGVPLSIKDLLLTRDAMTTAGSRVFGEGLPSDHDAAVVRRLRRAGALIIGKTNLNEFALGVTTENHHFGPTRNPFQLERVPGGSSGGSAAAVAAGMGYASVGTDTRGSIRIPASCCGITGLKPTYGAAPVEGVLPLSWTLDHVGPMTRTVEDSALLFSIMTGRRKLRRDYEQSLRNDERLRIGIVPYFWERVDPAVRAESERALAVMEHLGCDVREVEMRTIQDSVHISHVICLAEAAAYHEQHLATNPDGFGPAVRKRLEGFSAITGIELVKGERARLRLIEEFNGVFANVDCLLTPTMPALPPRIGQQTIAIGGEEETVLNTLVRFTSPENVAGVPALSIPCGITQGLPVGLQIIAAHGREDILFRAGAMFQRATDHHLRRPPLPV